MRSPSSAPCVNGEDGSTESTPTVRPASRRAFVSAPISVDLPTPGRSGEADDLGLPGVGIDLAHELPALGAVVLDERDRARERAAVAVEQALCERRLGHRARNHRRARPHATRDYDCAAMELLADAPAADTHADATGQTPRRAPEPLRGGPFALARFMRANHMLTSATRACSRACAAEAALPRAPADRRLCFSAPGVKLEIGRRATLRIGRWAWIGHGCKIRVHEGEVSIGAKTVIGQECTISAYQHVSIGRECIIADRVMLIDFDHGVTEVERPIREQGIYKRAVRVGHNVWIGYGACILRGVTVGENSIIGTSAVVTKDVPANAVVAGAPARVLRMRDAPADLRWQ